jgi:hypothetical protein
MNAHYFRSVQMPEYYDSLIYLRVVLPVSVGRASSRILYRWVGQSDTDYEWCSKCNEKNEYYAHAINIMNTSRYVLI